MHPLKVSLEELYSGTTKKLSLAKNVVCSKCDGCVPGCRDGGPPQLVAREPQARVLSLHLPRPPRRKGSKSGASCRCNSCGGQGVKIQLRQIAPGMVQQMQMVCPECRGAGASRLPASGVSTSTAGS